MSYAEAQINDFYAPSGELVPAEAKAAIQREGDDFFRKPESAGATVDRDGLFNIHAKLPRMSRAADDTPEQKTNLTFLYGVATWGLIAAAIGVSVFAG